MRRERSFILVSLALWVAVLSGCATTKSDYRLPSYTGPVQKGSVLRQYNLDPALEGTILAMNPGRVSEQQVREVLAKAGAPRIVNIHGGIYPVYLCMESFSTFLMGMGYPAEKIRNPGNGSVTFSCYGSSAKIAGAIAWYYEKEGLRPMVVGHSQGGIQAVKVLHDLAGSFSDSVTVYNPLTGNYEDRTTILDPFTGQERPVVGVQVSYSTAVGAGGFTRFLPNQWVMTGRLRTIPDTTVAFTGFIINMDLLGGDLLGFGPANLYRANGKAEVRNVWLPFGSNHVTVPVTAHLVNDQKIKDWINNDYVPSERPEVNVEFESNSVNILWAADVWYSIKKHWVLELQRLIRARRDMANAR